MRSAADRAWHLDERRFIDLQRSQPLAEAFEITFVEAGADAAGVTQFAILPSPYQQRCKGPTAVRFRPAADHELLLGEALDLEPVARALPRAIGRVGPLGDDALHPPMARALERLVPLASRVFADADRSALRRL